MNKEKRKELKEFLDIAERVIKKERNLLSEAVTDEERYEAYKELYNFVFSEEVNGRLQEICPFVWFDPDMGYDDDYIAWRNALEDGVIEVKELSSEEEDVCWNINRQIIEEFCEQHLSTHTDWTGTRVETKEKCDSVGKFVDMLMEYIEENHYKC